MRKLIVLFVLFITSIASAEGPRFSHKDSITDREFENVYQDIRSMKSGFVKTQNTLQDGATFYVSSGTISGNLTLGSNATSANQAPRFRQVEIVQSTYSYIVLSTLTVLTNFINSGLSTTITPTSASNKIRIRAKLGRVVSGASSSCYIGFYRDSTNINGTNGLTQNGGVGATSTVLPAFLEWTDNPATTSAITYSVRFRSSGGVQVELGDGTIIDHIVAEEINEQ